MLRGMDQVSPPSRSTSRPLTSAEASPEVSNRPVEHNPARVAAIRGQMQLASTPGLGTRVWSPSLVELPEAPASMCIGAPPRQSTSVAPARRRLGKHRTGSHAETRVLRPLGAGSTLMSLVAAAEGAPRQDRQQMWTNGGPTPDRGVHSYANGLRQYTPATGGTALFRAPHVVPRRKLRAHQSSSEAWTEAGMI